MATKIWVGTDTGNEGDWSVAANWLASGVPANGDDVYLENSSQDVTAGFDQSAVALSSLNIAQSYTGKIGDSSSYLQIGASAVNIGQHHGPGSPGGSGRIKLDLGTTTAAAVVIQNTGTSADDNKPPVRLECNNADTTIEVRKGKVGIAFETGETSTVGTITASYVSQVNSDADVFIGSGVTLTTLNQIGGDVIQECGATTVTTEAGTLITTGSGAVTTMNVKGGTVESNSTGTITACNITGGTADFTKSAAARTVTTLKIDPSGVLKYDPSVVTLTNKIQPYSTTGQITLTAA